MNFDFPFTPFEPSKMPQGGYQTQGQTVNQVVNKCFVEDVPYYVNYHTHCVNNVVRRHIQVPTYSTSEETVYYDEWNNSCGCGR